MLNPLRPKLLTVRKIDIEKFGCTAGCPACEVHRAGLPVPGQGHTVECRKRLEDVMMADHIHSDPSQSNTGQAECIIKDLEDSWAANPSSSSGLWSTQTCPILRSRASTWTRNLKVTQKYRLVAMRHPWRARELQKLILTKGDPSDSEMEDSADEFACRFVAQRR